MARHGPIAIGCERSQDTTYENTSALGYIYTFHNLSNVFLAFPSPLNAPP